MTFWYWHNWSIVLFGSLIFPYRPINDALSTYWPIDDALSIYWPIDDALSTYWPIDDALSTYWPIDDALSIYWPIDDALSTYWSIDDALSTYWPSDYALLTYWPIDDALSTYWPINDALLTCLPIDSFIIFKVDQAILSEEDRVVCIRWDFLFNFFLFLPFSAYDPQEFGFLDLDPQKYADPRIRIQAKNWKKNYSRSTPKSEKKRDYKNFLIYELFIKF